MSLIRNKKATLNYEIIDTLEVGIELLGTEVKSLRASHGNIDNAFAVFKDEELEIVGMNIPAYQIKNAPAFYDPERPRKLILHKKQIVDFLRKRDESHLTLFPISLYIKGRKIKVELALGRGKKKYDKRETLKKKAIDRDLARELRGRK